MEIVTVRCPGSKPGLTLDECDGQFTVEYHPHRPPLFRIVGSTCQHPQERFFDPYPIWTRAAHALYDRHQEQKRKAQTTTGPS